MRVNRIGSAYTCLALFWVLSPLAIFAQVENSSINGVAKDSSGAVIPGVKITALNSETKLTQIAETSASGDYLISSLPPGDYRITAEHIGFQTYIENVTLTVSQEAKSIFNYR